MRGQHMRLENHKQSGGALGALLGRGEPWKGLGANQPRRRHTSQDWPSKLPLRMGTAISFPVTLGLPEGTG